MTLEFVKIKFPDGTKRWYFKPKDLVDVNIFCNWLFSRERKAAMVERELHTFTNKLTGKKVVSYHAVTELGIAGQVKESIYNGIPFESLIDDLIKTTIKDRIVEVQKEDQQIWFSNGVGYMVTKDTPNIIETTTIQTDEFHFPGKPKITPADFHVNKHNEGFDVVVEDAHIGVCTHEYECFRIALHYMEKENKRRASEMDVTYL